MAGVFEAAVALLGFPLDMEKAPVEFPGLSNPVTGNNTPRWRGILNQRRGGGGRVGVIPA
ncbi:hypothetical protein MFAL_18270 [Mycolicibacterium fallax]|nr:hypothetical protein MFAL_18270 [Mycolicibacterium fallax]